MKEEPKPLTLPMKITIGEKYRPAIEIDTAEEAAAYFDACVRHTLAWHENNGTVCSREEAEKIERINIGYYAGYYDFQTQERVERLYNAVHPIFGSTANGPVSPEEAFRRGKEHAEKLAEVNANVG